MRLVSLLTVALLMAATATATAHDYRLGDLEIMHPHARATLPGAPVAGGYLTIRNNGAEADRLISVSADFAGRAEVHEMKMDGDVMKMREVEGGLEIPAGGEVQLRPGGFHIMFMKLDGVLDAGESRKAKLTFKRAGEIEVDFSVEEIKPGHSGGHGDMSN